MSTKVPDLKKISGIARNLELVSANWREVSARRFVEQDSISHDLSLNMSHTATGARVSDRAQLLVIVRFRFIASTNGQEKDAAVVEVEASLALRYQSTQEFLDGLAVDDVQEFADVNGVYNAWPYWRELLQSATGRVGLYGIVAPLLKVPVVSAKPTEAADREHTSEINSANR